MVTVTSSATARRSSAPLRRSAPRYWPGLDGLRALAVSAVVLFHLAPGLLPGGWLGVDLFFVISGYLITTLLADERRRRGGINLPRFWLRRVRRLYPAIVVLVVVVVPVAAACARGALAASRLTVPFTLAYATNWWFIFHRVPYFQRFGPPSLFLHLWSLAIEEQYYLLWPPLLVLLLRRLSRPRVALVALAGAVASGALMVLLYHGAGSVDRVYYGTDTHAEGLLFGSALALVVPPTGFPAAISDVARRILDRVAGAALALWLVAAVTLDQTRAFTWRGGIFVAVGAAGIVVVVAAHPASRTGRVLGTRPLRWLGTRSYSVYLWHWPLIVLTAPLATGGAATVARAVLVVLATAGLAEASYRWVETPWRTGRAQRTVGALLQRARWRSGLALGAGGAVGLVASLLVFTPAPLDPLASGPTETAAASSPASFASFAGPPSSSSSGPSSSGSSSGPLPSGPSSSGPSSSGPSSSGSGSSSGSSAVPRSSASGGAWRFTDGQAWAPSASSTGADGPSGATAGAGGLVTTGGPAAGSAVATAGRDEVLAIGDSVMLAAADELDTVLGPHTVVDAAIGRQVQPGLVRLSEYEASGALRRVDALVIGLGSNGPLDSAAVSDILATAAQGGVPRVVFINVRVPESWQATTNASLAAVAHRPGVAVINWYRASADTALLYPDGVHPDPAGQVVYAHLVQQAITASS